MRPMNFDFDAQVTAALFDNTGAVFALGDGSVRFEDRTRVEAHDGAVLCACVHPSGDGIVTGGDDGKVVWTRRDEEAVVLATAKKSVDRRHRRFGRLGPDRLFLRPHPVGD